MVAFAAVEEPSSYTTTLEDNTNCTPILPVSDAWPKSAVAQATTKRQRTRLSCGIPLSFAVLGGPQDRKAGQVAIVISKRRDG
jgi:hypothetical protein